MVLCKVAYLHVVTNLQVARKRNLVHDTLHESRLSLAVLAHESHLLATLDGQRHVREDCVLAVVLAHVLADNGVVARAEARREFEVHGRRVHLVYLDGHNLLQLLYSALHLHSLCRLISETLYEVLDVGYFFLLILVSSDLLFASFVAEFDIFVVLHLIVVHSPAGYFDGAVGDVVDECAVVADKHQSLGVLLQKSLQPSYTLNVKVVGGLVEKQDVGMAEQNLRQLYTHTPSSAEFACRTVKVGAQKSETCECTFYFSLIIVASKHLVSVVFCSEFLHELGVFLAFVVGTFGKLLVQPVNLFLHLRVVGKRLACLFLHGGVVLKNHHLRKVANRCVRGNCHVSACGVLQPADYLQHS